MKEAEPEIVVDDAYPQLIEAAAGYTIEPMRKLTRPADLSLLEQDLQVAYFGPYIAPRRTHLGFSYWSDFLLKRIPI